MASTARTPNNIEGLSAQNSVTGQNEYLQSTAHALDVYVTNGGSGGGDVQYTDGQVSPTHPIGNALTYSNGTNMIAVSSSNPLPVNASVSITGVSTAANQTSGGQKTQVVDASGNVIGSTSNALNTYITGGTIGNTSFQVTQATASQLNATVVGTGTFAVQAAQSGTWNITNISGTVSLPTGAATSANQTNGSQRSGSSSSTVNVGQTTSGTTAVQLTATSISMTNGILVQALSTNTASVFIGGTGVTTATGFELQPGQAVPFTAANITSLYVVGSNTSDKVCWNVL